MRQFIIKNARGEEFDLMRKDAFFHLPDGLGASWAKTFTRTGFEYIQTDQYVNQKNITGEMVFKGYAQYAEFARFCSAHPLVLGYLPLDEWNYINCDVQSLGKAEIQTSRLLICPIDFVCYGQWYRQIRYYRSQTDAENMKVYSYKYPYRYGAGLAGYVTVDNVGILESPMTLLIYGPVTNPRWAQFVGGKQTASGYAALDVDAGEMLVISSSPSDMRIELRTADTMELIRDAYADADFSTQRFLYAPPGNSSITFTADEGAPNVVVEVMALAETV